MSDTVFRRGLESVKKEAKRWLDALRDNDPEARARYERAVPGAPPDAVPGLRDVQHALAREHGYAGWNELREAVERIHASDDVQPWPTLAQYEHKAVVLLEAYRTGTPEAMEAHYRETWHRRAWPAMRTYAQLDIGKRPASPGAEVELSLEDARLLVAREYGFRNWEALKESTTQPPRPPRVRPIPSNKITDEILASMVGNDESITHLDLSGSPVTERGLEVLRHLPRLESLNLMFTNTGDGAIRLLAGRESLRHFWSGHQVTDAGLALLHDIPAFKTWLGGEARMALLSYECAPNQLTLRGTFTDRGMQALRGLEGLFGLNVDDARLAISAAAMEPLTSLPNLGWLAVDARDDWMPYIADMPRLRFLGVQDTAAGDDGFVALSTSRSIEHIWGRRCHNLRTRGFTALANMPALRALSVSCLNVGDDGLAALPDFPALRELMPMDVPDAGYRHIGKCEQLESLILMYCRDTTDAATEHITSLRNLSYYFNSYTTITDRTPALLSTIDSLERVTFDSCHELTNDGVAALARLPKLRELSVSGLRITPEVARAFPPGVTVVAS
jgi:hypothetical protein